MQGNWTINETKQLFKLASSATESGEGLNRAFRKMADASGKSINSIRNYYYSQLKLFEMVPSFADELGIKIVGIKREAFEVFSEKEIDTLVRTVLKGKAQGRSVRAVIASLAGGCPKTALRLQNKYRSMIAHHRTRVEAIMHSLSEKSEPYFNPYQKRVVVGPAEDDNVRKLSEYIASLDNDQMADMFKKMMLKN